MNAKAPARVPLHDDEAEGAALGAAMLSPNALDACVHRLRVADFYRPAHARVFEAITRLYGRGAAVDIVTVCEELRSAGQLGEAGGQLAVASLVDSTPVPDSAGHYAEIVRGHAMVRRIQSAAWSAFEAGFTPADAKTYADDTEAAIFAATEDHIRGEAVPVGVIVAQIVEMAERAYQTGAPVELGLPTGLRSLDHIIGGMRGGNLVLVAARPSLGKSSLGFQVARHVAGLGKRVLLWSIEMSAQEVALRLVAAHAHIPTQRLIDGNLSGTAAWARAAGAIETFGHLPMFIVEGGHSTPIDVRSMARRVKADLIVLDYIQLLTYPGRHERREEEVSAISRSLKGLAMEMHVPVLALAQLNRDPERSGGRDPVLSDLRDSGSLEQDADVVILLSRSGPSQVTAHVAKHRNGPVGKAMLQFTADFAVFTDGAS